MLGLFFGHVRPAVSIRARVTWFTVQSGWADQIRAAAPEAIAVAELVPFMLSQYERKVASHQPGNP
ncbi:hypothetical protein ABB07_10300 [Streptomyces incarnatus]|uniref:Uncharacterized protein n=1 Tax=Streptomyces incarnatus TaxID=665007 RepID=A0ABM5THI4_9ACTN|nr:hypothetical protein ABB07_10300 [Streptomyces incarnatus]